MPPPSNLPESHADRIRTLREHPENVLMPGDLFMRSGPQDYVGAALAITATLYFRDAHLPEVREAVAACFDEYEAVAGPHLTWLWHEGPRNRSGKSSYARSRPLRTMLARLDEDDALSFGYVSGKQPHDAGEWEFHVFGRRGWEVKLGHPELSCLRFSMPILYVEDHPTALQAMFAGFAARLRAAHGHAGYGLVLSLVREDRNQPVEAWFAERAYGLDVGSPMSGARHAQDGIKTVAWLTALDHALVDRVGGLAAIRAALPEAWFALYDYGNGLVVQAGPRPDTAPVHQPRPASLVLPNMLFRPVRLRTVGLHYGGVDDEPRLNGDAADQWLARLDVAEDDLPAYRVALLDEPRLTEATTLARRA